MRNEPQKTAVSIVGAAVNEWRHREGWSRESVVIEIVAAHERINGPAVTGITFDSNSRDTFRRAKVNAEKVFRWLDDVTKDCTLLPLNFLNSILIALPADLRLQCLQQMFQPVGVQISHADNAQTSGFNSVAHASSIVKESGEAACKLLGMSAAPSQAEVEQVRKELTDVKESAQAALRNLPACATKH